MIQPHIFWVYFGSALPVTCFSYQKNIKALKMKFYHQLVGNKTFFKRCVNEDLPRSRAEVGALIKKKFPWRGQLSGNSLQHYLGCAKWQMGEDLPLSH